MAWPKAPKFLNYVMPPVLMLGAIPYFLLGLILVYIFGFALGIFPMYGGYTLGTVPTFTLQFIGDVLWHATLPALSIILVSMGGWALGMRALFMMTQGEDYVDLRRGEGAQGPDALPQVLDPQRAAAAGDGARPRARHHRLRRGARRGSLRLSGDRHDALQWHSRPSTTSWSRAIIFVVIVSIGVATFILDIIYPLLDPRITYRRA